jgi:glucan biosynthesis protein C
MSTETAKTSHGDEHSMAKQNIQRMFYLDNLRLLFTILVTLHHICLTYTGERGWYYYDPIDDSFTNLIMMLLMTINRNWVLQCFFLLSGYFTPGSLDKKGLWIYIKERLIHIGIPLAFFVIIIRPPLYYFTQGSHKYSFVECIYKNIAPGPAWFLEVLLVF